MKKLFFTTLTLILLGITPSIAQFQIIPQLGLNLTRSTLKPSDIIRTKGAYGVTVGCDFRIGKRFYVQPGAYFLTSRTVYLVDNVLGTTTTRVPVDRYLAGVKLWGGFKIINAKNLKLRIALGPSYDFYLKTNLHDDVNFSQSDFNNGSFNVDGNLGLDFWRISLDAAYTFGLSKTFSSDYLSQKPKYQRFTVTLGFIIGRLSKKAVAV